MRKVNCKKLATGGQFEFLLGSVIEYHRIAVLIFFLIICCVLVKILEYNVNSNRQYNHRYLAVILYINNVIVKFL